MPDRAHVQLILVDAEGGLGLGELDVGPPQLLVAPVLDVGAQHVGAFGDGGPRVEGFAALDVQAQAGRTVGGLQGDVEAGGGALVALEEAADSRGVTSALRRLIMSASSRLREPSMRPASLTSAATMRWLNLPCMACSLRRRSAERHRIAVSPVS